MANKKNWLGILVLAFGMTVLGCTDSKLNGTWVNTGGEVFEFNNRHFEYRNIHVTTKGVYTTTISGSVKFYLDQNDFHGLNDHLNVVFFANAYIVSYSINGNTLMLDGYTSNFKDAHIFTKQQESNSKKQDKTSKNSGGKSVLVGRWVHESGATRNKPENMELLKDGTGVCDGSSITWKVEGNRFIIQSSLFGIGCDYRVLDSKLTLNYDDGSSAIFVKR